MPIDILMPQLSPTMTEGRLSNWLKKEGDEVSAGDVIAEVETDKATMEVEASDDGILHKIIGKPGDDIPVGIPIAVLAQEGEKVAKDYTPTSKAAAPVEESAAEAEKKPSMPSATQMQPVTPALQQSAAVLPQMNRQIPAQNASPMPAKTDGKVIASPVAKRLASERGVDLSSIVGTGPNGRVTKADVENAAPVSFGGGARQIQRKQDVSEKLSPMRKAIASRLTASKQLVPHFYLTADVRMDELLNVRKQLNDHGAGQYKLSVNDFIIKACALALASNPTANAAWAEDAIVTFGNVDISVAVAIEGGLITPIVFNADQKSLVQISNEVKQLAALAKAGELKPAQYEGGSFSLSNLGMYGVNAFSAIINPPQAAILAVGKSAPKAVVSDAGEITSANVMTITLSVDHRVIDGALGAQLIGSIQNYLEKPAVLVL